MHFESKTRAMIDDQPQCTTLLQQEIVDVNVILNQAVTAIFCNIIRHGFEFPEALVATSRLHAWTIICQFDMAAW